MKTANFKSAVFSENTLLRETSNLLHHLLALAFVVRISPTTSVILKTQAQTVIVTTVSAMNYQ